MSCVTQEQLAQREIDKSSTICEEIWAHFQKWGTSCKIVAFNVAQLRSSTVSAVPKCGYWNNNILKCFIRQKAAKMLYAPHFNGKSTQNAIPRKFFFWSVSAPSVFVNSSRLQGSMKLVMLSSDNFQGAGFFGNMSCGLLGSGSCVTLKPHAFRKHLERIWHLFQRFPGSWLFHILSPDYIINILTNFIHDMCVGTLQSDSGLERKHHLLLQDEFIFLQHSCGVSLV